MKRLTLLTVLVLTVLSTPVFGEWIKVTTDVDGNVTYLDFDRIKQNGGYVYYWDLSDWIKPSSKTGTISMKSYTQLDCNLFRHKILSSISYKESMGMGVGTTHSKPDKNWNYPSPDSSGELSNKLICDLVKKK